MIRPSLARGGPDADAAAAAVGQLVGDLQDGWDRRDAAITDRQLAADVLWGSPFGDTVDSADELHAIHVRLKREGVGGRRARFEIVKVLAPAPDVAVAQVRRVALDDEGAAARPSGDGRSFSEMALYVLVRHQGTWWLAAGQNTPVRISPEGER